eukprot:353985_1
MSHFNSKKNDKKRQRKSYKNSYKHDNSYQTRKQKHKIHYLIKRYRQKWRHTKGWEASEIIPDFMWLGNRISAKCYNQLQTLQIKYILNVADEISCAKKNYKRMDINYLELNAKDNGKYYILCLHLDDAIKFIKEAKHSNCKILVHCMGGVNRSAAIVVGYLLYNSVSLEDAIKMVMKQRPFVLKNDHFVEQLIEYELYLNKKNKTKLKYSNDNMVIQQSAKLVGKDDGLWSMNLHRIVISKEYKMSVIKYCMACSMPSEYCRYGDCYLKCLCYLFKADITLFKMELINLKQRNLDVCNKMNALLLIYDCCREMQDDLISLIIEFTAQD